MVNDRSRHGTRTAIVIGAGIAGLATAVSLSDRGWNVTVLERDAALDPAGAGLALAPNGTRALASLGLPDLIERASSRPMTAAIRKPSGKPMVEHTNDEFRARYGAPLVSVLRIELLEAEYGRLDPGVVRFNSRVTGMADGAVEVEGAEPLRADLIVGADGIYSQTRRFVSESDGPRPSGLVAFRGITSFDRDVPFGEWWAPGIVTGLIPLHDGTIYWYAGVRGDRNTKLDHQLDRFAPIVGKVVRSTPADEISTHELFDLSPQTTWTRGRVALIGDAAHAMLPWLGQGACSALIDAVALGEALDAEQTVELGLARYERVRREPATRLIRSSRTAGKVAMLRFAPARLIRDFLLTSMPKSRQFKQLDPILGRAA